ncbi:MAG: hypothetical protein JXL80_17270 [Planctomycetes bacterium]|nr:hypothetical protein [Planctomycetota bacterium]
MRAYRVAAVVILICVLGQPCFAETDPATVATLRQGIGHAERQLRNLRVEGTGRTETWNADQGAWEYGGESAATVWYTGIPGSKARVDYRKQVCRWIDGPEPFSEDSFSAAFNGRVGQVLYTRQGSRTRPVTVLEGTITGERPMYIAAGAGLVSQWNFSLYGFLDREGERVSVIFDEKGKELDVENRVFNDTPVIELAISKGKAASKLYLDPARNYALIGYEVVNANGVVVERRLVNELRECAPGIYYPVKSTRELYEDSGVPRSRTRYEATAVVVNDPGFNENVFSITWPPGTYVVDQTTGIGFRVEQLPEDLDLAIDDQVLRVQSTLEAIAGSDDQAHTPTGGTPSEPALQAVQAPEVSVSDGRNRTIWVVVPLLAVLAAVIGFIAVKQRRSRAGLFVVGVFLLVPSVGAAVDYPLVADELGSQRIENCGVRACAFTLRFFGRDMKLAELAEQLAVGLHWERACSMRQLKDVFAAAGLVVVAYKEATLEDMVERLNNGGIGIMHVNVRGNRLGHYHVLAAVSKEVLLIDAGAREERLSLPEFYERFRNRNTGFFLHVSEADTREAKREYTLRETLIDVDLGTVTSGQGQLVAEIPVRNPRRVPLSITEAKGSCSCFMAARFKSGGTSVPSGGADILEIVHDRAKFGLGDVQRSVVVLLKDTGEHAVRIILRAHLEGARREERIAWIPETLDYGLVDDVEDFRVPQRITIILPRDVSIVRTSTSSDHVILVQKEDAPEPETGETHLLHRYDVVLSDIHASRIQESVVFELTEETMPRITIPIKGERSGP